MNNQDDLLYIFSKNLKYYRIKNNLTQSELAEKLDLTDKYISELERGRYYVSLQVIDTLSKIFNIPAYLLIKYDETHLNAPIRLDKYTGTRRNKK